MRILALDVGERRIGIALSDALGLAAHPLLTLQRTSFANDIRQIRRIFREQEAESVVVGLPVNMDGTLGPQADRVMAVADKLKRSLSPAPVVTWDERLTTVADERMLIERDMSRSKRRDKIDQAAAVLILQGYLDSLGRGASGEPG